KWGRVPPILRDFNSDFLFNDDGSSLSFWQDQVFSKLSRDWQDYSIEPLQVLITNIPIKNDLDDLNPTETAHLNPFGHVSGLGHPSLSVVSSYRIFAESNRLFSGDDPLSNQKARYLGEYLIAHELGHALLG